MEQFFLEDEFLRLNKNYLSALDEGAVYFDPAWMSGLEVRMQEIVRQLGYKPK